MCSWQGAKLPDKVPLVTDHLEDMSASPVLEKSGACPWQGAQLLETVVPPVLDQPEAMSAPAC